MQIQVAAAFTCALIALHQQSTNPPAVAQDTDLVTRARALITESRALDAAEVQIVRDGAVQAMRGKYFSGGIARTTLNGAPVPGLSPPAKEEFQLDPQGVLRFRRVTHPARGEFQPERVILLEYTDMPAMKCTDRAPYPGKRLTVSYSQDNGKWYISASITIGVEGLPPFGHPLELLFKPGAEITDVGLRTLGNRRVRGLRGRIEGREDSAWFDVDTLMLAESSVVLMVEGKRLEMVSPWESRGGQLSRPAGVAVPDCL